MPEVFIPLLMALQGAPATPSDLPPAPIPESDRSDPAKRIYVADSHKAARLDVEDPTQEICVRTILPGSRVKARTVCQDKAGWKAYVEAQEAMNREWDLTGKGFPPEAEFVQPVAG